MRANFVRLALVTSSFASALSTAGAQMRYQTPPADLVRILEAPGAPVSSVSPNRKWILVTTSDPRTITIRDMAEPAYYLAGSKIGAKPNSKIENIGIVSATVTAVDGKTTRVLPVPPGGRLGSTAWARDGNRLAFTAIENGAMRLYWIDLPIGTIRRLDSNAGGRLGDVSWSADGRHVAYSVTTPAGTSLWAADIGGRSRRLTPPTLNTVNAGAGGGRFQSGPCVWLDDRPEMLCRLYPTNHGAPPKPSEVPTGPIVQESFGRSAPTRTYEYLLSSPDDEALFDYYFTDQLALVPLNGPVTRIGTPGMHSVTPSPDGNYLLVRTVQRPYSYQVPMQSFPSRTEVWNLKGSVVKTVTSSAVAQEAPSTRDAVVPGIRNVSWRSDAPATLVLVQALDSGNPRKAAAKRDRISLLSAPFSGVAAPFFETEYRYGGITWISPSAALVTERLSRGARTRTWLVDPSNPAAGSRKIWDRSSEERYTDPGSLVMLRDPVTNRESPLRSADGRWVYLAGEGASPEGDRPFLDRFDLGTAKSERVWQSAAPYYESVIAVVDPAASQIITRRESATEPPNYFARDVGAGTVAAITHLGDPAPYFAGVKSELITYSRPDGVKLSATMYLPPNYDKSKGRLPFLFWAYPREFQSDSAASEVVGSAYQFKRPTRSNYMMMLLHGYGVLDNPTMPIIGRNGKEPNDTYVEQLVADAQAAADKIVEMGVANRDRLAIGGHSYGAFMTVNLLAHSDIFRTGIAESGAYNRTLTPFGFQAEPRTYWEAPDVYNAMSPFNYANKINEPVLLIHGQRDDNSGTFPINSERLFAAIKGLGGSVRYVQLPLEPHGYTAVETTRHLLWEYVTWLDKYVKNAPPRLTTE